MPWLLTDKIHFLDSEVAATGLVQYAAREFTRPFHGLLDSDHDCNLPQTGSTLKREYVRLVDARRL